MALCGCGCGEQAGLSVREGKPKRFLHGHSSGTPLTYTHKSVRIEYVKGRKLYVAKCVADGCENELRTDNASKYRKGTKKCNRCSKRGQPFKHVYTRLINNARRRGISVRITYKDLLLFTKQGKCTYCEDPIPWRPYYPEVGGPFKQRYFLDRKDSGKGYTKENTAVCCSFCNLVKRDFFTFEEFLLLSPILKKIRIARTKRSSSATAKGTC